MRRAFLALAMATVVTIPNAHAQPAGPVAAPNAAVPGVTPTVGPLSWSYGPYQYDPAGNIIAIGSQYYVYDPMSRLTKASTGFAPGQQMQQVQDFTYDVYGNLTEMKTEGVPVSTMSVNAATNRVTTLDYDEAGNVTRWQPPGSSHERQYAYDALSRLVKESTPTSSNVTYHVYTASDERYWSYSDQNGAVESHFTLRGLGNEVLRDFRLAGTTWTVFRDYVYRDGTLLASLTPTQAQHISVDHLGTPRLITNDQRYRIGAHTYQPYGAEWTDGTPQEGDVLKFTGHERDRSLIGSESNALDYMHARYYAANMGRFFGTDWMPGFGRNPQSWNRYAYVYNSPVRFIDPLGLCTMTQEGICVETITVVATDPWRQAMESAARDSAFRDAEFDAAVAASMLDRALPLTGLTLREHGRATGYGLLAFTDGVIPFVDPLENVYEDSGIAGLDESKLVGEITRDVELALIAGGATLETRAGASASNWVTRNLFRWGKGAWKGSGGKRWHFHVGPGARLMKHHLPAQFKTWRYHAAAVMRAWLRGKR